MLDENGIIIFDGIGEFEDFMKNSEFTKLRENAISNLIENYFLDEEINFQMEVNTQYYETSMDLFNDDTDDIVGNYFKRLKQDLKMGQFPNNKIYFVLLKDDESSNNFVGFAEVSNRTPDLDKISISHLHSFSQIDKMKLLKNIVSMIPKLDKNVRVVEFLAISYNSKNSQMFDSLVGSGFQLNKQYNQPLKIKFSKMEFSFQLQVWSRNIISDSNEQNMYQSINNNVIINKQNTEFEKRRVKYWEKRKQHNLYPYFLCNNSILFTLIIKKIKSDDYEKLKSEYQFETKNKNFKTETKNDNNFIELDKPSFKLDSSLQEEFSKQSNQNSKLNIKSFKFPFKKRKINAIKLYSRFIDETNNKNICNHYLQDSHLADYIEFKNINESVCFACQYYS